MLQCCFSWQVQFGDVGVLLFVASPTFGDAGMPLLVARATFDDVAMLLVVAGAIWRCWSVNFVAGTIFKCLVKFR